ncbi:hypothetical protein WDU94_010725 [Cyamophila willieti]
MDKYLRPERFDVEPTSSSADKQWLHWKITFGNFLSHVKDATDAEKLQLLTNYLSPNVYAYVDDKTTYAAALTALEKLYVQPKNEIYARHCLASRHQLTGETVDQYLHVLRQMGKDCKFQKVSAEVYTQEYIRDAFISGLTSARIRQRLLENTTLTLEEAYNQARALELAEQQSASYVNPTLHDVTACQEDFVETTAAAQSHKTCYFCGNSWHPRSSCPAKEAQCSTCSKTGHYSRVCQSKASTSRGTYRRNKKTSASTDVTASITAASPSSLQRSVIDITVNNVPLKALVDTGSSLSFINRALLKKCRITPFPYHRKISMANSSLSTDITGQCRINLRVADNSYKDVTFLIMSNLCCDVLIGHDVLQCHAALEVQFHGPLPPLKICNLAVAKVEPVSLFANLSPNCSPTVTKSRKQSIEDRQFIRAEIERMLQDGIIEESNSPWRAQAFVVRDGKRKPRMVIDYSQTINKYTLLDAYPLPRIEDIVSKVAEHQVYSIIDLKSAYHQVPIIDCEKQYTAFEASGKLYHFLRVPFGVTNGVACFQRTVDRIVENEKLEGTYPYLDDVTVCGRDQNEHDENLKKFLSVVDKYNLTLNKDKCKFSVYSVSLLGYNISNKTIKPDPERLKPLLDMPVPHDTASLQRALGMFSYYSKWVPSFSDKVRPLLKCSFPLQEETISAFKLIKQNIAKASTAAIESDIPFTVETDASHHAIAATLSQQGRPVAFFSRTLNKSELQHSSVEKEAYAIVESLKYWRHYLIGRSFKIITDQRSVSFMFQQKHKSKIKNEKIVRWRLELSCFNFDIVYRPGSENAPADALSRISAAIHSRQCFIFRNIKKMANEQNQNNDLNDYDLSFLLSDSTATPGTPNQWNQYTTDRVRGLMERMGNEEPDILMFPVDVWLFIMTGFLACVDQETGLWCIRCRDCPTYHAQCPNCTRDSQEYTQTMMMIEERLDRNEEVTTENVHVINGAASDVSQALEKYDKALEDHVAALSEDSSVNSEDDENSVMSCRRFLRLLNAKLAKFAEHCEEKRADTIRVNEEKRADERARLELESRERIEMERIRLAATAGTMADTATATTANTSNLPKINLLTFSGDVTRFQVVMSAMRCGF